MFNSLRSRLWLTYTIIIFLVLSIVAFGILFALRQSPLLYRQVYTQLDVTAEILVRRLTPLINADLGRILEAFTQDGEDSAIKVALFDGSGRFLASNLNESGAIFCNMVADDSIADLNTDEIRIYTDNNEKEWFYKVRSIEDKYYLVTAVIKPEYRFSAILQDEFMGPILQAGAIVLFFAFFISLAIGNWIAMPLKSVSDSAEALSDGDVIEIPLEGPIEVRRLAKKFNDMSQKVSASAQSQRDFVANVSHEFKTPLTSIQGYAQAIKDDTITEEQDIEKAASVILTETNRLHRLVMDLLTLAKLEAGTADMQHEPVSIRSLLQNMVDKFSIQSKAQKIELRINTIPDVDVLGDGDRLAQVLSNLIDNALKYTKPEGTIEIDATLQEDHVTISVQDSGMGISTKDSKQIFDRFYQTDSSRKIGKKKGFGLGLSIAKEIIQSHNGKIWVESELGKGSSFFVQLPILRD